MAMADLACVKHKQSPEEIEDAKLWEYPMKDIALRLGLFRSVTVVPCDFAREVSAYIAPKGVDGVVGGTEYLIYNPKYLRSLSGGDPYLVRFILGHEIGHFINNHLLLSDGVLSKQMELEADYQGACAVARSEGTFTQVLDVIKRIRKDNDDSYPTLEESSGLASMAFSVCSSPRPRYQWVFFKMSDAAASERSRIILELWGDWLRVHSNVTLRMFCTSPADDNLACSKALDLAERELILAGAPSGHIDKGIWAFNDRPKQGIPSPEADEAIIVFSAPVTVRGVMRRNSAGSP